MICRPLNVLAQITAPKCSQMCSLKGTPSACNIHVHVGLTGTPSHAVESLLSMSYRYLEDLYSIQ
jgi:hypothetical protein